MMRLREFRDARRQFSRGQSPQKSLEHGSQVFCPISDLENSVAETHYLNARLLPLAADLQPHRLSTKKNFCSSRPNPGADWPVGLTQKLFFKPRDVAICETPSFNKRPRSRNGDSRCPIVTKPQDIPPRPRMPHKLQSQLPRSDAQPIILWLRRALPVEQKLKLHARSLSCQPPKTIPHCGEWILGEVDLG